MTARKLAAATVAVVIGALFGGTVAQADAHRAVRVAPDSKRKIRGDVLWMRIAPNRELLAPFTMDYRGDWCWAPASVFEESCTMTVSRRRHGRRTLTNGSKVAVRVTYTRRF
jgi:hypothetical protein